MDPSRRYGSARSRTSSSITNIEIDPREKIKDCCRKIVAFMCTQVGVGALVIAYTLMGAAVFMKIESTAENTKVEEIVRLRSFCAKQLYAVAVDKNIFNVSHFRSDADSVLKQYQTNVTKIFQHGYDERQMDEVWSFPAALMFALSIITMVGYGNLVPKTTYGKVATIVYALFGIPLYVLYFLNTGELFANCFKWVYRKLYHCSTPPDEEEQHPKKIIVPSTACLWVIGAYVLTGAVMFGEWEHWGFLDSVYFCVTSLCKLGLGDLVPGADVTASNEGNQTKLVINFVYMLLGLGLVAMCYNLMREEIKERVQEMQEDFNQCLEDTKVRLVAWCRRVRGSEEY